MRRNHNDFDWIRTGGVCTLAGLLLAGCSSSPAQRSVTTTIHHISASGVGEEAGTVTFTETPEGILVQPNLRGFRPGFHAFHAHENPSCDPAIGESGKLESGRAAGPHYNGTAAQAAAAAPAEPMPMNHEGMKMEDMSMDGMSMPATTRMVMRGDMPQLTAGPDGTITATVLKTGPMTFDELYNRAVVMHPYGEDGKDPERPADSSATVRIACGLVPQE